jgi:4-hydroxy-tetrahydrodipicolinate reductase
MEKIKVMMSGLPGKMAYQIALAVEASKDMKLLPYGLTGPEIDLHQIIVGKTTIDLFSSDEGEKDLLVVNFSFDGRPDIVIDFTAPDAIAGNVDFYAKNQLPFVMGTTGGDIKLITQKVMASGINAVVAPNMAKEIVVVQAMFEFAAQNFPGAFKRFKADPEESHQKTKSDTSGTAKAIVKSLQELGADCSIDKIKKNRTEAEYAVLGIPEEHWGGHGWHTYPLTRDDGNVFLSFTHNINGRQAYVDGTLDAVRFLNTIQELPFDQGVVFSMIDVLRQGH